jgi:hypothetical protein
MLYRVEIILESDDTIDWSTLSDTKPEPNKLINLLKKHKVNVIGTIIYIHKCQQHHS